MTMSWMLRCLLAHASALWLSSTHPRRRRARKFRSRASGRLPGRDRVFHRSAASLAIGHFVQRDSPGGAPRQLHVTGYVYQLIYATMPIGFGMFKQFLRTSLELWLIGIGAAHRRQGHGRALIQALLSTPAGQLAHLARVNRGGLCSEIAARLLAECGFVQHRTTSTQPWLVHPAAASDLENIASANVAIIASD